MYISSINFFVANSLLLCLINPLYSRAERSSRIPYEVNDPIHHQSRPIRSETVPFDEQLQSNVPKSPEYNIYHRNYNSVKSKTLSKDLNPEIAKQNAAKSAPESEEEKQFKPYYYPESWYTGNRGTFKKEKLNEEARKRDEEILKKMNMLDKFLSENTDENDIESKNTVEDQTIEESSISEETKRVVRQVRKQRPGFFWTLARLAFETFNDTRSAVKQISNIIGQNFEPDMPRRRPVSSRPLIVNATTTTAAPSNDQNTVPNDLASVNVTTTTMRTTTEPYKFTVNGVQNLILRNLRGLVRLFNIEWRDALNQSEISVREFQKDLGNQIGGFLRDNPNAY